MTFTTRPELEGTVGMVASTHWLASAAGMACLEAGGNAFDAAVAAGFTLQVVEPHLNGPGGDLPVIFAGPGIMPTVLCAQGPAPAAATAGHYRSLGLDLIPGAGPLAAVVPGATVGWLTLLRDHGRLTLRQVTAAAVHHATVGCPALPALATTIDRVGTLFRTEWPTSAALYPGTPGRIRNPVWAATLQRLIEEAETSTGDRDAQIDHAIASWRTGFVAAAIDAFARIPHWDSSGDRHPGVLTADDLAGWLPGYEPAARLDFRGLTVCKTAAWGQGPVLLQQLALLDGFDLAPGTVEHLHTMIECAKLAFADREAWYGDAVPPDAPDGVPLAALLSAGYAAGRRRLVGGTADQDLRPGHPAGRAPRLPAGLAQRVGVLGTGSGPDPTTAEPTVSRTGQVRGDTCQVAVADRFGNLVAATPSGGWLQSSPVIPDLGFPLGSRLQMAWLEQGLPNSLTPGRRPRTTLSPSLALRDGEPVLAFGTPGGDQQDQWQLGFLLNHVVGGMGLQQAIDAPTLHSTHFPSSFHPRESYPGQVVAEPRLGPQVLAGLHRRGHQVLTAADWSLGRICAVGRDPDGGLRAAADPRGQQCYAVGR